MVRRNPDRYKPQEGPKKPLRTPEPEYERAVREHREYWSPEAVELRAKYVRENVGFHIRDNFSIRCDAFQSDGAACGNVIGMAPLPDDHDGLCNRCRNDCRPHPPRITLDPAGVVWGPRGDAWEGHDR